MSTFKQKVINTWDKKGEVWLAQLPFMITKIAQQWQLNDIKPVNNMSYNYVALAKQHNKIPVALKISCDEHLLLAEYKALTHFNGHGAIKVLDIDKAHYALLLEQASPGYLLKTHYAHTVEATIKIYAQVVEELASHPLLNNDYPHVNQWCEAIDRIKDQRIEQRFIECARTLRSFLLNSTTAEYLCHGDLHLENIIQHGEKWLSIDPKGIIGEKAFEAAAFDLISTAEIKDTETIQEKIISRTSQLSKALNLSYERLLSWIFLRIIISAQWFIEDNGCPNQMLILATHFYSIVKNLPLSLEVNYE